MPDVKKLITGFLIIAAAASSSALVLSGVPARNGGPVASGGTDPSLSLADQNAFVPTQADVLNAVINNDPSVVQALNDPKNLTSNYTDVFLNSVSDANPDGMQADADGNVQVQQPDIKALAAQIGANPNLRRVPIPDWDAEAQASFKQVTISNTVDIGSYSDALNSVFNKNFIQSGVQSLVGQQDLDPSNLAAIASPIASAATDAAQTQVPAKLTDFHKSLVKMLVYEKNMVALGANAEADPVKSAVIYQAQQEKYILALQGFGIELQRASAKGLSLRIPMKGDAKTVAQAFLETYLGIPTAHAQWVTFDPSNFGEWILNMVNGILLQVLKNTLTAFIQQRVLKWIQGSGAPKFVQQFGATLVQAYSQKALASLSQILANTCSNIGPLFKPIQVSLQNAIGGNNRMLSCPLPNVSLSQITDFYNNFNAPTLTVVNGGGWGLYGSVLNPNGGSYYSTMFGASDVVSSQGSQAQQAAQTKITSNQGFKSQDYCPGGGDPNGTSTVCGDGVTLPSDQRTCPGGGTVIPQQRCDGVPSTAACPPPHLQTTVYTCLDGSAASFGSTCPDGKPATTQSNEGMCPPDTPGGDWTEPKVSTPGQSANQTVNEALGGHLKLITNANSIGGVLASAATSLLNTLVAAGVTAATKAATQGLTSIVLSATAGGASSNGGVTPDVPSQPTGGPSLPPTQCQPKNPQCTQGPGGQCTSGFIGGQITFSATGADGLNFAWNVAGADCLVPHYDSNNGPVFSPYFTISTSTECIAAPPVFPLTVPVTVTGSDGKSDTCLAVIAQ